MLFLISVAARISENHHGPRPPPGSPLEMPSGFHGSPASARNATQEQMLPYLEEIKAGELKIFRLYTL